MDGRWGTGRRDVYGSGQNRRGAWYEEAQAPPETTADKLKAIAMSKPPSLGSLIKQVQVLSLLDDLFLDLDRVFFI